MCLTQRWTRRLCRPAAPLLRRCDRRPHGRDLRFRSTARQLARAVHARARQTAVWRRRQQQGRRTHQHPHLRRQSLENGRRRCTPLATSATRQRQTPKPMRGDRALGPPRKAPRLRSRSGAAHGHRRLIRGQAAPALRQTPGATTLTLGCPVSPGCRGCRCCRRRRWLPRPQPGVAGCLYRCWRGCHQRRCRPLRRQHHRHCYATAASFSNATQATRRPGSSAHAAIG